MKRDERQVKIFEWVKSTFGQSNATVKERILRFIEEALELSQAEGITINELLLLINHVYSKPVGTPDQEVGGIGVTLLAYCESKGLSAETEEIKEMNRVLSVDKYYFQQRHNIKAQAGVAKFVDKNNTKQK